MDAFARVLGRQRQSGTVEHTGSGEASASNPAFGDQPGASRVAKNSVSNSVSATPSAPRPGSSRSAQSVAANGAAHNGSPASTEVDRTGVNTNPGVGDGAGGGRGVRALMGEGPPGRPLQPQAGLELPTNEQALCPEFLLREVRGQASGAVWKCSVELLLSAGHTWYFRALPCKCQCLECHIWEAVGNCMLLNLKIEMCGVPAA